jgi:hypothetical protein
MSKIALAGAVSGTATFTIESPATSTNRTLTLPDETGTIVTTGITTGLSASALSTGTLAAARLPAGSVLQVVSGETTTSTSTGSTTFVDATNLNLSITPTSASSKILVLFSINITVERQSTGSMQGFVRILRGATDVLSLANFILVQAGQGASSYVVNSSQNMAMFVDSPNTTSSTNYKAQIKSNTGDNAALVFVNANSGRSTMTLMEIAA